MNFIKEQLTIWRLRQNLRAFTRPDRAFLKSARTKFVVLAQQRTGVRVGMARHLHLLKYATVTIATVFAMTSGMAVFADANNVPATHPLYNLKRVSEQVRLGLSTQTQQVELHRVFAHRRLEEASELETENNQTQVQNRIDGLKNDFQNETETGLNQAQGVVDHPEVRTQLCNDILDTIQNKPMGNRLPSHMINRIKSKCDNRETIKDATD